MLWGGERSRMKREDKEIAEERERERKLESETTQQLSSPTTEIIEHFSHPHPLIHADTSYAKFLCDSCAQNDSGMRYHCAQCNFDLHKACANSPITWLLHHMPPEEMATFGLRCHVITTFAHPNHLVITDYKRRSFRCDQCNGSGNGTRFHCESCKVAFHQQCAENPTRLTSHLHPQHELELKLRPYLKTCDLCGTSGPINSRMYSCKFCGFYLHPRCSQWPLYLLHPLHPPHLLVLKPCDVSTHTCSACMGLVTGKFKYSCSLCGLDFDLHCIWKQSRLGLGDQEVRQNNVSDRDVTVLPITNLSLPNTSHNLPQAPAKSSIPGAAEGFADFAQAIVTIAN